MNRTRSYSDLARVSMPPVVSHMPAADVNQLTIRIHSLKSIPPDARLTAFFNCVKDLKTVPVNLLPLIVGELQDATTTLSAPHAIKALKALSGSAPLTIRYQRGFQ